jgi:hypothetical protein
LRSVLPSLSCVVCSHSRASTIASGEARLAFATSTALNAIFAHLQ